MTSRRLALALLIAGSLGIIGICALEWATATVSVLSGAGTREFTATGAQLLPSFTAWAVLTLAASLALIALRGSVRQAVGVLVAAVGVLLLVQAIGFGLDPAVTSAGETLIDVQVRPWWLLVALCAGLVTVAGVLAAGWSRDWPALGARYEGSSARRARPASPWDALDAGQDPTLAASDAAPDTAPDPAVADPDPRQPPA